MQQKAIFGAGCFWGVESTFRGVAGVRDTSVGYAGGHSVNPTYKQVCADRTGHAQVVQVEFDSTQITFTELLSIFWASHNPFQRGESHYRSLICCYDEAQLLAATASKREIEMRTGRRVITEIRMWDGFYRAEEYHQRYHEKRGMAAFG